MQRKNNLLKIYPHKRRSGFAMIMAIIVVVVISALMALSLALTTQTGKRTVDLYLYEQAALYSKSAAEIALESIAQLGCQNSMNFTFDDPGGNAIYDANITMMYVYNGAVVGCTPYPAAPLYIITPEQNGSVLMDIAITVSDSSIATEPIRYFRRSIQKL